MDHALDILTFANMKKQKGMINEARIDNLTAVADVSICSKSDSLSNNGGISTFVIA